MDSKLLNTCSDVAVDLCSTFKFKKIAVHCNIAKIETCRFGCVWMTVQLVDVIALGTLMYIAGPYFNPLTVTAGVPRAIFQL